MTSVRQIAVVLGLAVVMFTVRTGYAQQRPCTKAEGRHALDEADMQRSWAALYRSFKSYRQCDDGAIGEGYSESVARILADHWKALPQLAPLARRDAAFRAFVLGRCHSQHGRHRKD
jgi:hypothetical protein